MTVCDRSARALKFRAHSSLKDIGLLLIVGAAASACAYDEGDRPASDPSELVVGNDVGLNGVSLNGMSLNGMNLNGMNLNGMSLNGMGLDGSQLIGTAADGQPIAGAAIVGATLSGLLSNGETLPLRIDGAGTLPAPSTDVWAYLVSYHADGDWSPLCGIGPDGQPAEAIPLSGTWNNAAGEPGGGSWTASTEMFTFGCRGAALAKCVELGYEPWSSGAEGTPLREHHQACTRMLRADYCGDGTAWTANGTPINVYDSLGIQSDDASWPVDAEWIADGAVCTNEIRDFRRGIPGCVKELDDPACGDFEGGALLIDEYDAWTPGLSSR